MAGLLPALATPLARGHLLFPTAQTSSAGKKDLFELVPPATSGITWRHVNGRSPNYYLPETTGAGCAFIDYDNDGWLDVFILSGTRLDGCLVLRCAILSFRTHIEHVDEAVASIRRGILALSSE